MLYLCIKKVVAMRIKMARVDAFIMSRISDDWADIRLPR